MDSDTVSWIHGHVHVSAESSYVVLDVGRFLFKKRLSIAYELG